MDIDVHALLQAYIRVYRGLKGETLQEAEVRGIERRDGRFTLKPQADLSAPGSSSMPREPGATRLPKWLVRRLSDLCLSGGRH